MVVCTPAENHLLKAADLTQKGVTHCSNCSGLHGVVAAVLQQQPCQQCITLRPALSGNAAGAHQVLPQVGKLILPLQQLAA